MPDNRIDRQRRIYHEAMDRPLEGRSAFLAEACGSDRELHAVLEAMIAAAGEASGFLERPAWESFAERPSMETEGSRELEREPGLPFERLGEFRLIRRIGEGGMGVVYLAVQESLGRQVALKVLRPEKAGSFEAEKRFWREVEAVSRLNHPGIVTVFGSGEENGVRYFAMELLPGFGLDEELRRRRKSSIPVSTGEVLGWIRDVALALHSAHEAGIVHRDVKPSNIRIIPKGAAKLMDFGVARHLNLSSMTITGEFRGTPRYAAPEQVEARSRNIDARTDVYSLGVTLYEALTGRVPFEGETTKQVFRQILERDPLPPRRLNPAISRDVETVILAAMEKEPARRYRTMQDLADDIERLRNGEMIQARPAGLTTRVWKKIRRNPIQSVAVCVACLAVAALFISIPWYIGRLKDERDLAASAGEEAKRRRDAALAAENEAVKAKEQAVTAKIVAMEESNRFQAIATFMTDLFSSASPWGEGKDVKVAEMLDKAAADLEKSFRNQPDIVVSLRNTIGAAYKNLGFLEASREQHAAALDVGRAELGEDDELTQISKHNLGTVLQLMARYAEAEPLIREAYETCRRELGAEHPRTLVMMGSLMGFLISTGRHKENEPILREYLDIHRRVSGEDHPKVLVQVAGELMRQGRYTESEPLYRKLVEIKTRSHGAEHPTTLQPMEDLARCNWRMGRYSEAEQVMRKILELRTRSLGEEHHETLSCMCNLAVVLCQQGRLSEGEELFVNVLDIQRRVLGPEHPQTLVTQGNLGMLLKQQNKLSEAESVLREVLEIERRKLGDRHPNTLSSMAKLAVVLMDRDNLLEAEALYMEGVESSRTALPAQNVKRLLLEKGYGVCLFKLKHYDQARPHLLAGFNGLKAVLGENHHSTQEALQDLVNFYEASGEPEKAAEYRSMIR